MKKKLAKRLLLIGKLALATVLLAWVLSKAHWGPYVLAKNGGTWTWMDRPSAGDTQFVRESSLQAIFRGRLTREPIAFDPEQYVPTDPDAPQGQWQRRYVRPGLAECFRRMDPRLVWVAMFCFPLSMIVVSYRFWFLLRVQNIRISLWEAIRLTFLGQFFNMVIPGTVGGDLVKAWYVSRHTHRTAGVIMTIFVDRLIGLVELVLMAGAMLLYVLARGFESFEQMRNPVLTTLIVAAITGAVTAFCLSSRLRRLPGLRRLYERPAISGHLRSAGRSIRIFSRRPGYLLWALVTTLFSHVIFLGGIAMLGVALGIDTPVYSYFVYLPLIYILGAIPITPGGVGWVENLFVEFFRATSAGLSAVVALAMLARLLPMLWGLPGLLVAITGPRLPKPEQMQEQLQQAQAGEESCD